MTTRPRIIRWRPVQPKPRVYDLCVREIFSLALPPLQIHRFPKRGTAKPVWKNLQQVSSILRLLDVRARLLPDPVAVRGRKRGLEERSGLLLAFQLGVEGRDVGNTGGPADIVGLDLRE